MSELVTSLAPLLATLQTIGFVALVIAAGIGAPILIVLLVREDRKNPLGREWWK